MSEVQNAFSLVERITLAKQFRILEKLDHANAAEYGRKAEILEQGLEGQYGAIYGRFAENRLSTDDCRLVEKILLLHSWLSDWSDESSVDVSEFHQVGFDANSEWHHLKYAQFLYDLNPA